MFILEIDATNAGVAKGGLVSTDEIRILICYILHTLRQPVPYQPLSELLHFEGVANYFEVGAAFSALGENGLITESKKESGCYKITPEGSRVAETLKASVPISVREKAYALTVKMLSRLKYEKETEIEITPLEVGFNVRCTIKEGELELMSVTLFVPDEAHARSIKQRFIDDPTVIYSGVINLLTENK